MKKKTKALQEEAEEFICRELRMNLTADDDVLHVELRAMALLMAKFYEYRESRVKWDKGEK